jgi:hypothetical protein
MQANRTIQTRKDKTLQKKEITSPTIRVVPQPDATSQSLNPSILPQTTQNPLTSKERLLLAEGGYYLSGEAVELLGISETELAQWREADKLIGLPRKDGTFVYPKWQFSSHSILSGLEVVLARFPYKSPWGRAAFMLDTWVSVGLGTPLAGLRDGKLAQVLALVNCLGEQGAL